MARRGWSREELIVAFNLYCKIPFGRIHIRNPEVIELAAAVGRTPSAVSWKLANFARLDPSLQKRNISGAAHGGQAEEEIWDEFFSDWERLSYESERLLLEITHRGLPAELEEFPEGRTRETLIRARVNQGFFRVAVLAAYEGRCCVTGLGVPQLLSASHIVPWAIDIKNRTNPRNGLCLNAIHDRAFDCGLMTITSEFKVKLSPKVKGKNADIGIRDLLTKYEGVGISVPRRFVPSLEFLQYHNQTVFIS